MKSIHFSPDERSDRCRLNIVQLLDGLADLALLGKQVGDKDQRVGIFDLFHRRFGGQRVFQDVVGVQLGLGGHGLAGILGGFGLLVCLGRFEVD